ncbi:MAG: hypothetical protein QW326_02755, partial [Fervidicoccaceae archaeon]
EIRKRLCLGISSPTHSVIFDSRLVDFEAVRRVVLKEELSDLLESKIVKLEEGEASLLILKLKEKNCIALCEEKCGSRESQCFGECIFSCISSEEEAIKEKVCR